jgi:RNA ligase
MLEKLNRYYEDGLLYKQVHPSLPLTIWNYSEKVQFEVLWNEDLLMCRGLVTDDKGKIVARPFKKFFNLEEGKHTPTENFDVYEKLDGSLGILFNYNGEWVFATRGSFTSDQSVRGFEMLKNYDYEKLHKDYTYLFEIIYNDNRIVVGYSFEDVVLLGMIHTETGYEVDIFPGNFSDLRFKHMISNSGLRVVKKFDGINDYSLLKNTIGNNEEGYIVKFSNGDRIKIKGVEYLRLHKIMTNMSTTAVWECLKNGDDIYELLKDVPDEFYLKINEYVGELNDRLISVRSLYFSYFLTIIDNLGVTDRKTFAEEAKKYEYPSLLFSLLDGKDISEKIWNIIRPEFSKL